MKSGAWIVLDCATEMQKRGLCARVAYNRATRAHNGLIGVCVACFWAENECSARCNVSRDCILPVIALPWHAIHARFSENAQHSVMLRCVARLRLNLASHNATGIEQPPIGGISVRTASDIVLRNGAPQSRGAESKTIRNSSAESRER